MLTNGVNNLHALKHFSKYDLEDDQYLRTRKSNWETYVFTIKPARDDRRDELRSWD